MPIEILTEVPAVTVRKTRVQETEAMPRKVNSAGESTQQRKTSMKRAMGAGTGHDRREEGVPDGGKWAGSGKGAKAANATRSDKKNHPNHG